jgi:Zn-dependent M28 family amino/carboxypeptidase
LGLVTFCGVMAVMTVQPSFRQSPSTTRLLDPERLRTHVVMLSETFAPRNYQHRRNLEKTAGYISNHLARAGGKMSEQIYEVKGRAYRNVIATFGPESKSRIVVGAHYDTYGDTPGADDNASGIAGLIELAYLIGQTNLDQHVDLVAYTLEEPPFFRTTAMGSARHAHALRREGAEVEVMICLEMIGYFSDVADSQTYPSALLGMLYPDEGNFIAVIGSTADRKLVKQVKKSMGGATDLPVHAMCAPKGFPGLDFSDHLNYWANGFNAVMITDTAFMRNARYHRPSDTADTLDYDRMADVVLGLYEAVIYLAGNED